MAASRLIIDVRNVPELIAELRLELARMLRETADSEASTYVADRLRAIAAAYESGQKQA